MSTLLRLLRLRRPAAAAARFSPRPPPTAARSLGIAAAAAVPSSRRELTDVEVDRFNEEGWLIIRGMFSADEAALLLEAGQKDQILAEQAFDQVSTRILSRRAFSTFPHS